MGTEHETWLNLTAESAIGPDVAIIDAHHHLWDRPGDRYLLEEILKDITGGHRIVQTVFVECFTGYRRMGPEELKSVGETEFIESQAAERDNMKTQKIKIAAGIIGAADIMLGAAVAPVLEAHLAASNRFRGIRYAVDYDASTEVMRYRKHPPGLMLDSKFREGFACLERYGLSFDTVLVHTQLLELADLAKAFPETTIVLEHIGCPAHIGPYADKHQEVVDNWKRGIAALKPHTNVFIKLGGMGMPMYGFGWEERPKPPSSVELAEAMRPYFSYCIEQFGVDRCMFESNFPVDKRAYSYNVYWNACKRVTEGYSYNELVALFQDTAKKAYWLR